MDPYQNYKNYAGSGYPGASAQSGQQYGGQKYPVSGHLQPTPAASSQYSPQLDSQSQSPSMATPPALSSVLHTVPLGSDTENSQMLDLVDRLRECRVDRFIDLPQVVAVGDQSSGKSSVLEALTHIPFPTDSVQCTRFATQIRLRRDAAATSTRTKVAILAYDRQRDQRRYDAFEQVMDDDANADFSDLFRRATALIFQNERQNFLSRDILSIERTGPDVPHLTIVDLPGIIHNPTQTQTAADVDAIAALSRQYMDKERTIILAVVGADVEYAKQVIVRRCKEADPSGIRTLGVITKPDMTLTEGRERQFLDLASNRDDRNRLLLGWHVLRNRAHNEGSLNNDERDEAERRFFSASKWASVLAPSQLGVEALRKKLSVQLIRHVASEVFKVQAEIQSKLEGARSQLQAVGPGFDTVEQMREEIHALCKRSAYLTRAAVQGQGINPLGEDFFPLFNEGSSRDARSLRSRVVIENSDFSLGMELWGAACLIEGASSSGNNNASSSNGGGGGGGGGGAVGLRDAPPPGAPMPANMPPTVSRHDFITKEVQPLIRDNPGNEVSVDINPLLVYRLFQQYSRKWPEYADQHVAAVQRLCEDFLREVMEYVWPRRMQGQMWHGLVARALEARAQRAHAELVKLKKDRFRYVRTYHSAYDKDYYKKRGANMAEGEQNKYEDTLTKMLLHYEHQLPTFINNVILQVTERHLLDEMEEIFDRERVLTLKDHEIRQLMEDDFATQTQRRELKEEVEVLQKGLDICRQIGRRPDLGPYESHRLSGAASLPSPSFGGGSSSISLPQQPYSLPSRQAPPLPGQLPPAGMSQPPTFSAAGYTPQSAPPTSAFYPATAQMNAPSTTATSQQALPRRQLPAALTPSASSTGPFSHPPPPPPPSSSSSSQPQLSSSAANKSSTPARPGKAAENPMRGSFEAQADGLPTPPALPQRPVNGEDSYEADLERALKLSLELVVGAAGGGNVPAQRARKLGRGLFK